MNEHDLPYTRPDIVARTDPFGMRNRPVRADHIDALLGAQGLGQEKQRWEILREQLMRTESEAWSSFFGESINVPEPPSELLVFLQFLDDQKIGHMEAHYLPPKQIYSQKDQYSSMLLHEYPGLQAQPAYLYKEILERGDFLNGSGQTFVNEDMPGFWIVTDNYEESEQKEDHDPYANVLRQLRTESRINNNDETESRKDISMHQIRAHVLPGIEKEFDLDPGQVRLISYLEYNVLGNAFHPEWADRADNIWFRDTHIGSESDQMGGTNPVFENTYGGSKQNELINKSGLSHFKIYGGRISAQPENTGFKPIIEFPA